MLGLTSTTVRLQLLRDPRLWRQDGSSVPLSRNDAALLALLAVDGPTSRERLTALLWPDADEPGRARNALRQRLFRLRQAAGVELVVVARETLALAAGLEHDLHDPVAALAADPLRAGDGDLLGSLDYPGLGSFSQWLVSARTRWCEQRRDTLAAIASRFEADEQIAAALAVAERLARDEPLFEHAQRRLMRLHYRRGDRSAALAVHANFQAALRRELGEVPSAETQALAAMIERSGALPVAAAPIGPSLLRPPLLVGRRLAWQQLDASRLAGRTLRLTGEPGIGKSRLLADYAAEHRLVLTGARPGDARVPFTLLARLLNQLDLGPAILDSLPDWVRAELARLLPALGESAGGAVDHVRQRAALERVLAAAAPVGVLLDDLQFADDASLELLPGLSAAGGAWVLALRAHEQPAVLTEWFEAIDGEPLDSLELGPLTRAEVGELLDSLHIDGFDTAAWAAPVHQRSGGNPLFVLETLRSLLAEGTAPATGAAWPLPATLRRLIDRRLQQLSAPALKLAQVAAVAGPSFSVDLASTVLGVHALDLFDAWRELESAHVMQGERFSHDLIFESVRDAVPSALLRWLHGQVATALAALQGPVARLGLHWREAGEPVKAAACFEQAAAAAAAAGRLAEQARWLEAVVEAWQQADRPRERFDAQVRRVVVAREALSPQASMQLANDLIAAAGDLREQGLAHLQIGACHVNAVQFDLALPAFDRAIEVAQQAGDEHTAQHARYLSAMALAQVEGPAPALRRMEGLAAWAEQVDDPSLRHAFLADLAILCDQADQRRRARPYFERALTYFDRLRETGNAAPTRTMFARSLLMLGDLQGACGLMEAAVRERAELSEGEGGDGIEVLNLGRVYCELGRYRPALALLEPSLQRLNERGNAAVQSATALVMARIWIHLGQQARAAGLIRQLPTAVPFHQLASQLWTRALLLPAASAERRALLDDALAQFSRHADLPFLRLPIEFDRLACEPGEAALAALRRCIAECEGRELPAPQMLGRLRLLQVQSAMGATDDALVVARGLQHELPTCHPVSCYLPELHLACRVAATAGGDPALARASQDAAVSWLAAVSQSHLAPEWRDGFAYRNPVNRDILTATLR